MTIEHALIGAGFLIFYGLLCLCLGFVAGRKTNVEAYERMYPPPTKKEKSRPATRRKVGSAFRDKIPKVRASRNKPTIPGERA